MVTVPVTTGLALLHLFLAAANAIVSFSLLVYILTRAPRNATTLSFVVLAGLAALMWVGEAGHVSVRDETPQRVEEAVFWLRVQFVGLSLLPAAYLHVSDMLLRSTGSLSAGRRAAVVGAYLVGGVWLALAIATDSVVAGPVLTVWGTHYRAGVLYPVFAAYTIGLTLWSLYYVFRARFRCLTASLRRRMAYLGISFILPALGIVPYLLATYLLDDLPDVVLAGLPVLASGGVSVMVVVLAYIVSYQGVMLPDRVVKQSLITYLLRGPFLGVAVTFLIITIPRLGRMFAIFSDRFLVFAVVFVIVVLQAILDRLRPLIERIVHQDDEIVWLEELNQRLLTSADLRELLNNTLIAVCEVLRVRSGFIVATDRRSGEFSVQSVVGAPVHVEAFMAGADLADLARRAQSSLDEGNGGNGHTFCHADYWLFPLAGRGDEPSGFLATARPKERDSLTTEEREIVDVLVDRASIAVEDAQLQRSILETLRGVAPEIEQVQQWGSQLRYANPSALAQLDADPLFTPEFHRAVRDALSHYWGGPKLVGNPLLNLAVVQAALGDNGNNPSQALRAVLRQSVETLRPSDDRDPMANEWILYNILRMRFLQGKRVKEIVQELVMSESDFYRKERAAIREAARSLSVMEGAYQAAQRERSK
jgi:hypothetical protein